VSLLLQRRRLATLRISHELLGLGAVVITVIFIVFATSAWFFGSRSTHSSILGALRRLWLDHVVRTISISRRLPLAVRRRLLLRCWLLVCIIVDGFACAE